MTASPTPTKNHMIDVFYSVRNRTAFAQAMQGVLNQIDSGGVFVGDNLLTFAKNLSFLHDAAFMAAFNAQAQTNEERAAIWRVHTLCWAAQRSLRVPGDFVECACYRGTSARIVCDYLQFGASDMLTRQKI